jgi:nucleotidyltransferase AbiEii toxin of type IV toxin-antitoxin system
MKLADSLKEIAQHLQAIGAPFAVVGGLAASARGEARFTRDIDLAVSVDDDPGAEQVLFELGQRGYRVITTVEHDAVGRLATARSLDPHGVVCDLIFATSGIEREVVSSAQSIEIFPEFAVPTATVEALLAMKVLSAVATRPRDWGDIQAMVRENPGFDQALVLRLLGKIEARGYARQQALVNKWHALNQQLDLKI